MKKNKNFIGSYGIRAFKLNTHYRSLDVSTWGFKKKDVLNMLKNDTGIIVYYQLPDCKMYWGTYFFDKTKEGYKIGCKFYPNHFINKIKNALLTMK